MADTPSRRPTNTTSAWNEQQADNDEAAPKPRKKGVIRSIGKWSARAGAIDVIWKDLKRVRPLYPELWRQVFSREAITRVREKLSAGNAMRREHGFPTSAFGAFVVSALICGGTVACVIGGVFSRDMAFVNQFAVVVTIGLSGFSALIYLFITVILLKRRANSTGGQANDE